MNLRFTTRKVILFIFFKKYFQIDENYHNINNDTLTLSEKLKNVLVSIEIQRFHPNLPLTNPWTYI